MTKFNIILQMIGFITFTVIILPFLVLAKIIIVLLDWVSQDAFSKTMWLYIKKYKDCN